MAIHSIDIDTYKQLLLLLEVCYTAIAMNIMQYCYAHLFVNSQQGSAIFDLKLGSPKSAIFGNSLRASISFLKTIGRGGCYKTYGSAHSGKGTLG